VAAIGDLVATGPVEAIRQMWAATRKPEIAPLVRAVFEVWGAALVQPERHGAFLERVFTPWRDGLAAALEADGAPHDEAIGTATLMLAAFNGLQLARLSTGEDATATKALELLLARINPTPTH